MAWRRAQSRRQPTYERKRPGWFTARRLQPLVALLHPLGLSVLGSRVLEVRGRSSGEPRRTPVNLLEFEGERYLVAPRGETQWVRNLRASGEGRCCSGAAAEPFTGGRADRPGEAADPARLPEALEGRGRRLLRRVGPDSSDEELARAAAKHPVFRLMRDGQ